MNIVDIFNKIPESLYWFFIFFSSFIENVFPPYPGDTITVFAASLTGLGKISFFSLISSVFIGSILGAVFMYFLGTHILNLFNQRAKWKVIKNLTDPEYIHKAHEWFKKYGISAIILSRFSAGIRFFVAIVAGAVHMNVLLFVLAFSIGSIIWNGILIYAGYVLGKNWTKVFDLIRSYYTIFGIVLGIILFLSLIYYFYKKRKLK